MKIQTEDKIIDDSLKDIPKNYDSMVWVQLNRCTFLGSQDTTNSGIVTTQDESGATHEIVRYNYVSAFIHAVSILYLLVELKHDRLKEMNLNFDLKIQNATDQDYKSAWEHFRTILSYVNKSGVFGYETLVYVGYNHREGENGETDERDRSGEIEDDDSVEMV